MTYVSRVLLVGFACFAFSATSFAGGPFGVIHVGKWQGAVYTTDKGAFSHCTAIAKFDSGLAIILAQNANRSWIIGVAAPSWPFRDKQPVKLVLTFDGQAQFDVSGTAARDKAVVGVLSSQAISALGKAHQLVVTATNQTLQIDLAAAGMSCRRSNIASIRSTPMVLRRPAIFPIPRPSRRRRKPRPSQATSQRKSSLNQTSWFRFQAAVSSSAKTRIS
jgi:hypothetical protein